MENPSKNELIASIASRMREIASLENSAVIYERRAQGMRSRIKDLKILINMDIIILREITKDK